jgi:putative membrane protein
LGDPDRKEVVMAKGIVFVILVIIMVLFVLQNTQVVDVQLLVWKVTMSRALMLLGTFVLGMVAGWLVGRFRGRR